MSEIERLKAEADELRGERDQLAAKLLENIETIAELQEMLDKLHLAHVQRLREIERLSKALREACDMVEAAGRAYVTYDPERLKALREVGEDKE